MDEFPSQHPNIGSCLAKLIVFGLILGLLGILLLGIVTGIVIAKGIPLV